MELLEKVEKLREKANVSYEDAKAALEAANGDILDAMIILEKEGKTKAPESENYTTKYDEDKQLPVVVESANNDNKEKKGEHEFIRKMKALWRKSCENYFVIERKDEIVLKFPIWLFMLIVVIGFHFVPIIMVIALFFGCHYSFVGEAEMKTANNVMDKADEAVQQVKDGFNKL